MKRSARCVEIRGTRLNSCIGNNRQGIVLRLVFICKFIIEWMKKQMD